MFTVTSALICGERSITNEYTTWHFLHNKLAYRKQSVFWWQEFMARLNLCGCLSIKLLRKHDEFYCDRKPKDLQKYESNVKSDNINGTVCAGVHYNECYNLSNKKLSYYYKLNPFISSVGPLWQVFKPENYVK